MTQPIWWIFRDTRPIMLIICKLCWLQKKFTTSYTVNSNHYTVNIRSILIIHTIIRMPIDKFIYIIIYINLVFITYDTNQIFSTNNGVTLLPFPQVYQITIKIDRVLKSFYISFILTHRTYQHYLAQCC